jgi:hypothetical protein
MVPDWLPAKLRLNGSMPEIYELLHSHYQANIVSTCIEIEGVPVLHNNTPDRVYPQYTNGFTHLITREVTSGNRVYDPQRAEKLSWVVPILQNYKEPAVSCFWYVRPQGSNKVESLAIWLEECDYILILRWHNIQRQKKIVVTAHSIDVGNRSYWQGVRRRPDSRAVQ